MLCPDTLLVILSLHTISAPNFLFFSIKSPAESSPLIGRNKLRISTPMLKQTNTDLKKTKTELAAKPPQIVDSDEITAHTSDSGMYIMLSSGETLPQPKNIDPIVTLILGHLYVWCTTHEKTLIQFADKVGPDQHARLCSLIWAFSVCQHIWLIQWFYKRTMKVLVSLCISAGWSGPALPADCIRAPLVHCTSYYYTKSSMVWTWNAPVVQSRQPLTYRLMESVGLGGPKWHGSSWQRGIAESGSSWLSTLMIDVPGDLVWDLPCVQQASYLEGGPLMWMLPLYLHVNQTSDYDIW